jgi:D-glucosaminate-6-phosphate ammonia-lyase
VDVVTGAEAACVTSGGFSAITLGVAACMTGTDAEKMNRLPDTRGMPNEVLMQRPHRFVYDRAVRVVGAAVVEVGSPGGATAEDLRNAVTDRTAAIFFPAGRGKDALARIGIVSPSQEEPLDLREVVRVARERAVPVLVDAANDLPPRANLRYFISEGVDLVCFSGGKAIRGPQSSGFLCGRRDLINAALVQCLDMGEPWHWRSELLESIGITGRLQQNVGRGMKVGKEEVIGLVAALKLFLSQDEASERHAWQRDADTLYEGLRGLPGVTLDMVPAVFDPPPARIEPPVVRLILGPHAKLQVLTLSARLRAGTPRIFCREMPGDVRQNSLAINPTFLRPEDIELVVRRMWELLG